MRRDRKYPQVFVPKGICGGEIWGAAIAVGGSLISGYMSSKAQKGAAKDNAELNAQEDELNFNRQAWLAQQKRLWQLQDRQYKQQAIAGFQGQWDKGGDIKPPNQNAEMSQLDNFDPNKLGALSGTPAPPLAQLAPQRPQPVGTRP